MEELNNKEAETLKIEKYVRNALPFFRMCYKKRIFPNENLMHEYYPVLSSSFKVFLILYAFYHFTDELEEAITERLPKKVGYKMDSRVVKDLFKNVLPQKITYNS